MLDTTSMKDGCTFKVIWSKDDDKYVGLCVEFPSLRYLDESKEDAYQGIQKLVKEAVDDINLKGR